jgi:catechol 2,3-dioxygenase-like lactoylglutathione lyase family enzyme
MTRSAVASGPERWNVLVPELLVTDLAASLGFWRDVLDFRVVYERPAEGFAFLERDGAQLMLEAITRDSWLTADLSRPFGRGLHFEIGVRSLAPLLDALARAGWPLWRPVEERWYRVGDHDVGQRQFLTQDPDGYLLRFAEPMGTRPPLGE